MLTAITGTKAAVVMTEWKEIVDADWVAVSRGMAAPKLVFDGRNALHPVNMKAEGFEYIGVGRPSAPKESLGC